MCPQPSDRPLLALMNLDLKHQAGSSFTLALEKIHRKLTDHVWTVHCRHSPDLWPEEGSLPAGPWVAQDPIQQSR